MKPHSFVWALCLLAPFLFTPLFSQIPLFNHALAFTGTDVESRTVQIDAAGNIYTTGQFSGQGDFDGYSNVWPLSSNGGPDIYIEKTDPQGMLQWAVSIGGAMLDDGTGLVLDQQGNPILVGGFDGTVDFDPGPGTTFRVSTGDADCFVLKLDGSNGGFQWVRTFGGPLNDYAEAIAIDSFDHLFIAGNFEGSADFDPGTASYPLTSAGGYDLFVVHLTPNGDLYVNGGVYGAWSFPGLDTSDELGYGIAVGGSGSVLVTGGFRGTVDFDPGPGNAALTSAGENDIFLFRLNSVGQLDYARAFGGALDDYGFDIVELGGGEMCIAGGVSAGASFDGGATTEPNAGDVDAFLARVDSSGQVTWVETWGGSDFEYAKTLAVTLDSGVFVAGSFAGTTDLDPGLSMDSHASEGGEDVFISRFGTGGNFISGNVFGGTEDDFAEELAVGENGAMTLVGTFQETVDFDFGAGIFSLSSQGSLAAYILLMQTAVGLEETPENAWRIYPNPTAGRFWVETDAEVVGGAWQVVDLRGVVLAEGRVNGARFAVDAAGLPAGMYLLRVEVDGKVWVRRFFH